MPCRHSPAVLIEAMQQKVKKHRLNPSSCTVPFFQTFRCRIGRIGHFPEPATGEQSRDRVPEIPSRVRFLARGSAVLLSLYPQGCVPPCTGSAPRPHAPSGSRPKGHRAPFFRHFMQLFHNQQFGQRFGTASLRTVVPDLFMQIGRIHDKNHS